MTVYLDELNRRTLKYGDLVDTHQGGRAYAVDPWTQLRRFLILGSDGGTFYVSEKELTKQSAQIVSDCLDMDGLRVVTEIVAVSTQGDAPRQQPAIFALALAAAHTSPITRRAALDNLHKVCRTGTHLFTFAAYIETLRGWGRGLKNAVANWYESKSDNDLIYQAIKYQQRGGWSHADLLRLSHPKTGVETRNAIYKWIVDGDVAPVLSGTQIGAMAGMKDASEADVARMVSMWRMPREAVPTEFLKSPLVWAALLDEMPMQAMVRNLGTMSKIGLLSLGSEAEKHILGELGNAERIKRSRLHPMALLLALATYAQGHGFRSSESWTPNRHVVDALDAAFYTAFGNVTPTNKRLLVAVDSSGSMTSGRIANTPLTALQAASAMALVTVAVEPKAEVISFDTSVKSWALSSRQRLDDVMRAWGRGGGTDMSLPWGWALNGNGPYDGIVVYTDSEDGYGRHAQRRYGYRSLHPDVRECVVATTADRYSAVDGPLALNVVGFDASAPQVISGFIGGAL
jgi:60 kDa SS-A/Ro ribonucleoprotein